jgi:hypothetical protein
VFVPLEWTPPAQSECKKSELSDKMCMGQAFSRVRLGRGVVRESNKPRPDGQGCIRRATASAPLNRVVTDPRRSRRVAT